jgi:hypothetical protein
VNVRLLEGLQPEKGLLRGEVPGPVAYSEGLVRLRADLLEGQKTGAFLDQRENHVMSAAYAQGEALDCFSYLGGFALQLATRAAAVDQSVARRTLVLGSAEFTRAQLEELRSAGQTVQIRVLGLATIAADVSPKLALQTISSVEVLGAFRATAAVKAALASRIV